MEQEIRRGKTVASITSDTFGDGADCSGQIALLHAMAVGLPIVATHKAYLADYVTPNKESLSVLP